MRFGKLATLAVVVGAASMTSLTLIAQEGADHQMDPAAMMEAYAQASQPGEMHALLTKGAGVWHTKGESYMPGLDPVSWEGTVKSKPIFDGRYVQEEWDIPNMMGFPFQGRAIIGFNNATGEFESVWIDSMSTAIFTSTGKYNESTKTLEMSGSYIDPVLGGEVTMRSITHLDDDNSYTMEMYNAMPDGTETCMMRVKATRGGADNAEKGDKDRSEQNKGRGRPGGGE